MLAECSNFWCRDTLVPPGVMVQSTNGWKATDFFKNFNFFKIIQQVDAWTIADPPKQSTPNGIIRANPRFQIHRTLGYFCGFFFGWTVLLRSDTVVILFGFADHFQHFFNLYFSIVWGSENLPVPPPLPLWIFSVWTA